MISILWLWVAVLCRQWSCGILLLFRRAATTAPSVVPVTSLSSTRRPVYTRRRPVAAANRRRRRDVVHELSRLMLSAAASSRCRCRSADSAHRADSASGRRCHRRRRHSAGGGQSTGRRCTDTAASPARCCSLTHSSVDHSSHNCSTVTTESVRHVTTTTWPTTLVSSLWMWAVGSSHTSASSVIFRRHSIFFRDIQLTRLFLYLIQPICLVTGRLPWVESITM